MDSENRRLMSPAEKTACAEASAWLVRLHGPNRTSELEMGLRSWLAADPVNRTQFERITGLWEEGATLIPRLLVMNQLKRTRRPWSAHGWRFAAGLAVFLVFVGALSVGYLRREPAISTGVGEQRVVRLADGSRMTLNSNSRVEVRYRKRERNVRVDQGEILFEVAQESTRPFLVHAGQHQVKALGTSFVVRYESRRTAVTLIEGKVAVSSASVIADRAVTTEREVTILAPGQRLVAERGLKSRIDAPQIDTVTAWRRGEVVLDDTPLIEAVAEMNRYDQATLVVDSPAINNLKISGIYHTGDSATFARMIAKIHALDVVRTENRIHLAPSGFVSSEGLPH